MSKTDRERWDERYADPSSRLKKGPHDLLVRHAPPGRSGSRALELACGLGRDALWLAAQGYRVDAIDISLSALRSAQAEMRRRELSGIQFIQADLEHFPLPRCLYDLVIVFRFLDRRLFPAIRERVRPGGLAIYQTFNSRQLDLRPTFATEHLLQVGELPAHFPGWTVLEARDEGPVSSFVGRKPEET
ncbi:MAG: class I SAM-dependent methyltransferase [Anaerolineae bacterium]|nr:class I SAM-dependent methyltransferase [Anaerolineae bacterium]